MPELLRLETLDFEFTVWANDISQRQIMYEQTIQNRAKAELNQPVNTQPALPVLRFAPELTLKSVNVLDIPQTEFCAQKCAMLKLSQFLFFENTQYQFEWVFLKSVTHADLAHRSKNINDAFRFAAESQTDRGVIPARLTGNINTGNDLGWLRLPLNFKCDGTVYSQQIAFEVLPTKMDLHQDLSAMYRAIDAVYPLWRFSIVAKTEQDAALSQHRGHFPLMWLANFATLRTQLEQGLRVISAAPHSRLQTTVTQTKAAKLKGRLSSKLAQRIQQDFANGQNDRRYPVEKKQLSLDTPENRFIKMVVNHTKQQLASFEAKLRVSNKVPDQQRLSDDFLNEINRWQQPLAKVLSQSFLNDVGQHTALHRESLVLQQKTGYSAVYRVWQELKFYLDVFGNQSSISMKSVAEIYEIWCFLCIKNILENDLGF